MPAGNETEGHDGSQGDTGTGVIAAHDTGAVIAHRIEPCYWKVLFIQYFTHDAGAQAIECAQVAHHHFDGVVRPGADRCHTWIGFVLRVSQVAVECRRATAELVIAPLACTLVVARDGSLQPRAVNTRL